MGVTVLVASTLLVLALPSGAAVTNAQRPSGRPATATPCSSYFQADSCSVTAQGDNSITVSYTVTYIYPICSGSSTGTCTASVFTQIGPYQNSQPISNPDPTINGACPGWTYSLQSNYSPILAESTTLTCNLQVSWGPGQYLTTLDIDVTELDGGGDTNPNSDHSFEVQLAPPGPTASFTSAPVSGSPGAFAFTSTSTSPTNSPLVAGWSSSDGGTGSGNTWTHQFDDSGTFSVTLSVTDANSLTDSTTQQVEVSYTSTGSSPGPYTALSPIRICDTRAGNPSDLSGPSTQCNGAGNAGRRLSAGTPLNINVAGPSQFGVPTGATAAVLNVTAIKATGSGYLTIYPSGGSAPTASNLNFHAGQVVANLVETGLGSTGKVSIVSNTSVDVAVDLEGYVSPTSMSGAGLYNPLATPARICDTRSGNPSGLTGAATQCGGVNDAGERLSPNGVLKVMVAGDGDVPATGVSAVVLNVTVVNPSGAGYVTAYPEGSTVPTASNLNYTAGESVPNRVIIPVNATNGQISLTADQATDLIVDVSGWFSTSGGSGSSFTAEAAPVRICDTRAGNPSNLTSGFAQCNGTDNAGDPIGSGSVIKVTIDDLAGVPSNAVAVVLNVTAIQPSARTHLTVYPTGESVPDVSDLNPTPGDVAANLVVATISASGSITIANYAGLVNAAVDVTGFYS